MVLISLTQAYDHQSALIFAAISLLWFVVFSAG